MNTLSDLKTTRLKRDTRPRFTDNNALLKSIYYYRKTALYVFVAIFTIGLLVALITPARYRSEARLLALTSDSYDVQSAASAPPRSELFKPDDVVNLEMQLLSSHDLHRAAVASLPGAPRDPVALEKAREKFTDALSVTRVSGANVIELALADRDPAGAEQALQALIKSYYATRAQVLTSGRTAMFQSQLDGASHDMVQANEALRTFQAAHGVADIDAQIAGAVAADTTLRQQRSEAGADLSGAIGSLGSMQRSAQSMPSTVEMYRDDSEATRAISESQGQLAQLEAKRADLAGRYMAGSPLIAQVDQQIAGLRSAITAQRGDLSVARRVGRNGVLDTAREQIAQSSATRAGLLAKQARLGSEIDSSRTRLLALNAIAGKIAELKQARDAAQDHFRLLSNQVAQARTSDSEVMNGNTNVRVIQEPDLPTRRSNSILLLIVGAIIAGIVLAGAALLYRVTTRKFVLDGSEAADNTDAQVIADLRYPETVGPDAAEGLRERLVDLAPAAGGGRVIAVLSTRLEDYDWALLGILAQLEHEGSNDLAIVHFEPWAYAAQPGNFATLSDSIAQRTRVQIVSAAWVGDEGAALLSTLRKERRWIVVLVPPLTQRMAAAHKTWLVEQTIASADETLLVVHVERTLLSAARNVASLAARLGRPLSGLIVTGQRIEWPRFLASE
jgi:uncharacterized protein involved in exopolysaccharide biosynthesis